MKTKILADFRICISVPLKKTMSRKENRFYVIYFIYPWIVFWKEDVNTTCNENAYLEPYKEDKSEGRRCVQGCKWIRTTLLLMLRYIYFSWMQFCVECYTRNKCIFKLYLVYAFFWRYFRKTSRPFFYNFWNFSFTLSCIFTLHVGIWT